MRRCALTISSALLLAASVARSDAAPVALTSLGPRIGLRAAPDQFVMGGQGIFWEPTPSFRMATVATLGLGDDATIVDLSTELHYVVTSAPLAPQTYFYVGVGPDLAIISPSRGSTATDLGLTLLGGVERRLGLGTTFFGEFRVQLHDEDDWFEAHFGIQFALVR